MDGVVAIAAALLLAFGIKAKNVVEDEIMVNSDNFTRWDGLFQKYAAIEKIDWRWVKAICMTESNLGEASSVARGLLNPSDVEGSKSSDGKSWGIMQFTLPTAKDMDPGSTVEKLNNPEFSIRIGAKYIAWLSRQFGPVADPLQWIVKGYNQGPGNTKKEIAGTIDGYAEVYWERFQRNLRLIKERQG